MKCTDALVMIAVVMAFICIPTYCFLDRVVTPLDNEPFRSAGWRNGWPEDRGHMARGLVDNFLMPGMTRDEVIELLGDPDSSKWASWYGRFPPGSTTALKYGIGSWLIGAPGDDSYVLVYLDAEGIVTWAKISGV